MGDFVQAESRGKKKRRDGKLTNESLLLCAARLTARKGFAAVTSKEICRMAGTNLAAVNYHFGSQEGLYEALIAYAHNQMVSENMLKELVRAELPPREKLERFLDNILRFSQEEGSDHYHLALQVWLRECFNNSQVVLPVMQRIASVKVPWLVQLFGDYTGRQPDEPLLYSGMLSFVAPFVLLNMGTYMVDGTPQNALKQYITPEFVGQMKEFAFAGLDSLCLRQ